MFMRDMVCSFFAMSLSGFDIKLAGLIEGVGKSSLLLQFSERYCVAVALLLQMFDRIHQ